MFVTPLDPEESEDYTACNPHEEEGVEPALRELARGVARLSRPLELEAEWSAATMLRSDLAWAFSFLLFCCSPWLLPQCDVDGSLIGGGFAAGSARAERAHAAATSAAGLDALARPVFYLETAEPPSRKETAASVATGGMSVG